MISWKAYKISTGVGYGKAERRKTLNSVKMASATGRLRADSKLTVELRKYGLCIAYLLCIEPVLLLREALRKLQEDQTFYLPSSPAANAVQIVVKLQQ